VSTPRILFIARAYPPTLGGMENFAQRLHEGLAQRTEVRAIINRRGKKALPAFLPYALVAGTLIGRSRTVDAIHLADALLAPLGMVLRRTTGLPVTASVCGLDVTYVNPLYQAIVPRALRQLESTMPISHATEAAMIARAPGARSTVIPLGVNPLPKPSPPEIARFDALCDAAPGQRIILSVGRLVARKGAAWFVEHVLSALPDDVLFVAIGEGPERARIEAAAALAGVMPRVRLLGRVDDGLLAAAYARASVFVMPNIPVPGDMEGFGLVALEAAAAGALVIASDLEGITEAVQHGRNGLLVTAGDAAAWVVAIRDALEQPHTALTDQTRRFSRFTREQYGWGATATRYLDVIARVTADHGSARELRAA